MRRGRRLTAVAMAVVALVVGAGCEPQMEIQMSLHRDGTIGPPEPDGLRTVVLTGVARCTRREPVDLFLTVTQGSVVDRPGEVSVPCGPKRRRWSISVLVDDDVVPGRVRVDVEACTNPAESIDEDCVSLGRAVDLAPVT